MDLTKVAKEARAVIASCKAIKESEKKKGMFQGAAEM